MGAFSIFLLRQKLRSLWVPWMQKDPTQGTGQGCVEGDRDQGRKKGAGVVAGWGSVIRVLCGL